MSHGQDYIDRIKEYRDRGFATKQSEERALLDSMETMGLTLGGLEALKAADTKHFPIQANIVSYVIDVNEYDDFMNGVKILIQKDGNKISKVSMVIRNEQYEEERIFTPAPRTVDGVKQWKEEAYVRKDDGIELKAQEAIYSSAEQAAAMIRLAIIKAAISNISFGHYYLDDNIPLDDKEAASVVRKNIQQAISVRSDIEALRVSQHFERLNTTYTLEAAWFDAKSELSFLQELGYKFDKDEGPLSIKYQKVEAGLNIKIVHDFGHYVAINIKADDNHPSLAFLSVSDSEGRDELLCQLDTSDRKTISQELKGIVLNEIETLESSWVPEEEYQNSNSLSM